MRQKAEESWPEHPLFPADEDEEPHRVEFIQVVRYEQGRALLVPTTFRAGELTSLDAINSQYGGGLYELIGRRCSIHDPTSMGRISAKVRYEIAGPSRPLVVDPNAPPPAPTMPAIVQQHTPAPAPDMSLMGIFTMMLQNSREEARAAAEAQRLAQERARQDSIENQRNMMQMQTTLMTGMMGVVTALVGAPKSGGGIDDVAKMADLFKTLGVLAPKAGGEDSDEGTESIGGIISNVADIVAGAVELKNGAAGGPPGSAAAVFAAGAPPPAPKNPDAI
jgi:hypothetical protein